MAAQLMIPQDAITFHGNELRTTSLKVAEAFGKLHKDVLRKIVNLDCSPEFMSAHFYAHEEIIQAGAVKRPSKVYEMTKDGFMFLVMGFTGKKAAGIKEAYINAFNVMHDHLFGSASKPANAKPHSDTIDADQQAMLLEVLNHRAAEELPELQQVVKNIITGQFEQAFGCTLDQLPKDKHAEAIRLILNAPLEGDYLPASESKPKPTPQAVFKAKRTPSDFDRRHGLLSPEQMFDCGWRVDLLWAVKWLKDHEGQTVKLEPGLTDQLTLELHSILHWYESYRNKLMDIQRIAGMGRLQ